MSFVKIKFLRNTIHAKTKDAFYGILCFIV